MMMPSVFLILRTIFIALAFFGKTTSEELGGNTTRPLCSNESYSRPYSMPTKEYRTCRTNDADRNLCNITDWEVCNNRIDCVHEDDECFCDAKDNTFLNSECFRCLAYPGVIVNTKVLCNGVFNCPDLSDECLCMRKEWHPMCNDLKWSDVQGFKVSETVQCRNPIRNLTWESAYNYSKNAHASQMCNENDYKRPESADMSLECKIRNSSLDVCKLLMNRINGTTLPEIYAIVNNGEERYFCSKPETIYDFCCEKKEYDRKSQHHFYNSTIPAFKVCDKLFDCENKEDECQPRCMGNFSSPKSMIKSDVFLVAAWIISLIALVGNLTVTATSLRVLYSRKRLTKEKKIIKILFLSLAISDLLVAIYTFSISFAASTNGFHSGRYCEYDRQWRSSSTCTALGVIFVIGSEQSVLTMLLIAFARVRAMRRPFARPPIEGIFIALVMAWIASILVATVPLFPSLEEIFVEETSYVDHKFFGPVKKTQGEKITKSLLARFGSHYVDNGVGEIGSWALLRYLINKIEPHDNIKTFGFYSHHSVCLPAIFATGDRSASWYTNLLTGINFFAFITMLIGYICIYKARKSVECRTESMDSISSVSGRLQLKIAMILFTDFCCWMPVCVASFVRFAVKKIPEELYLPTALIVLPINSALNPFIYSGAPEYLWDKIRPLRMMLYRGCYEPLIKKLYTQEQEDQGHVTSTVMTETIELK